jgi:hypothetical protein
MSVNKSDLDIFTLWQNNLAFIQSNLNLKRGQTGDLENNLLVIPPIQVESTNKNLSNYLNYLLGDSINKHFIKNENFYTTVWGFNSFSCSLETKSITQYKVNNKHNKKSKAETLEEISYLQNEEFTKLEKAWWKVLNRSGILFPNQMLYYSYDRTIIEIVWYLVSKIWKRHRAVMANTIDLYWPDQDIYLQNSELENNSVSYIHPNLKKYLENGQNIFVESEKGENIICSFKLRGISAGKLSAMILTETVKSIENQKKIHDNLIAQLLHLKDLGYIDKVEKKLDLFIKDDFVFSIAKLKRPLWSNWEVEPEVVEKLEKIKAEIETVEENVKILEKIYFILEDEADVRILSLFSDPFLVPAVSALGVGLDTEYALYFIEELSQIVIVSEKNALFILSLVLPEHLKPGQELQILIENEVDAGEYFLSQNLPIHKLVALTGSDLIGLEFDPIFKFDLPVSSNALSPVSFTVLSADLSEEAVFGTGIIPITPSYKQEHFRLANIYNLPFIDTLDKDSNYIFYSTNKFDKEKLKDVKYEFNSIDLTNHIIDVVDEVGCLYTTFKGPVLNMHIRNYDKKLFEDYESKVKANGNLPILKSSDEDEIDKIKKNIINYSQQLYYKKYLNYQTKVADSSNKNLVDIDLTEIKNSGIALPVWKSQDGNSIYIENISQLLENSLNPIYTLINSRKLTPENYADNSVVILGDRNTKLPLGLTAVFYKSIVLSEIRKDKNISLGTFDELGHKLLDEIFQIFQKHNSIQIILEPNEQKLLTIWLAGYSPRSEIIEERFYFYNPLKQLELQSEKDEYDLPDNAIIIQDFGSGKSNITKSYYVPLPEFKQLKLQRPYIDEIILEDGTGKIYKREKFVISNSYLNALLMDGSIWQELVYNTSSLKSFLSYSIEDKYANLEKNKIVSINGYLAELKNILIFIPNIFSYSPFKIDVSRQNTVKQFPSIESKHQIEHFDFTLEMLLNFVEKFGSDSIRYHLLNSINKERIDFSEKKLLSVASDLNSNINTIIKFLNNLLNKFPRNNQPISRNKYKHFLNNWLQIYTQNFCLQMKFNIKEGEFSEAIINYNSFINNLINWYLRAVRYLDSSFLPEIADCLCECLYWFSVTSFPIQPFSCERIFQHLPITKWTEHCAFSHPYLEFKELNLSQIDILDTMHDIKDFIQRIEKLRRRNQIKLKQPLYCDVNRLELDQQIVELILKLGNMQVKNQLVPQSSSEIIENNLGRIKVDITIYEELAAIAFGWDLERAILDFLKREKFSRDKELNFKVKILECDNEELVYKVVSSIDWHKLNIALKWQKDIDENLGKTLEVHDLGKLLLVNME